MPATLPTGVTPIHAAKGGKNGGMLVGLGVATLGLAAAAAMFFYVKSHKAVDAPKQAVQQEQVEAASTAKAGDKTEPSTPEVAKVDKPSDGALDINQLGNVSAQPMVAGGGPLPPSSAATAVAANGPKGPVKVNPDGTLDDAMKKAAGPEDGKPDVPSPASEGNTRKNLPDAPPQGSVTAALGAAKGAAKGCVAGADDVSTAMVTFGSSGAVQSVSVGGWAAGKPAASCIQSALKGANVGPFSKPTFGPVPVTIRP